MSIWSAEIKELGKIFEAFKNRHPKISRELEKLIKADDENMVLVYSRRCLEVMITDLSERELKRDRGTEPLKGIIDKLNREKMVPHNIILSMQNLNSLSTLGAHPKDFDLRQVKPVLLDLTTILEWYLKYMETKGHLGGEIDSVQEVREELTGSVKSKSRQGKSMIMVTSILLVAAIIIVSLIVFNVIGGGKQAKAASIGSIIILPFENYTGQDSLEWFVSGMHSSLIQDMGKIGSLLIPSETTSKIFKNANKTLAQITKETNVDAALETSVLCLGEDSICLNIRLIKPGNEEEQLWIADYKIPRNQILNWYNGVTKEIAREVNIKLTPEENRLLSKSRIVDREAYEDYLKARSYASDGRREAFQKALEYLNSAIKKEPDWAPLYAGLAEVWMWIQQGGYESPSVAAPKIYENLDKAMELDPDISGIHYLSGLVAQWVEWDWEKGEREFLKALAINPNDALSRMFYAQLLLILHRKDEALAQRELAISLDPLNPMMKLMYIGTLIQAGEYETAASVAEEALVSDPENLNLNFLVALTASGLKKYDKAISAIKHVLPAYNIREEDIKEIERIYKESGYVAANEEILRHLEQFTEENSISPHDMALNCLSANKPDKAMDWLEKGFEMHDPQMMYIASPARYFEPLYGNPRFIAIVKKMNLPLPEAD